MYLKSLHAYATQPPSHERVFVPVQVVTMRVRLDFTESLLSMSSKLVCYQSLPLKASFFPLAPPAAIISEGLWEN